MGIYLQSDYDYYAGVVEQEFCSDHNLIVDRVVLATTKALAMYTIPNYVTSIRRITYRGRQIDPFSGQEQILSGSTPSAYSQGEPRQYIYSNLGQKVIRFFPTPAEDLDGDGDPWAGAIIREKCIVEFFRVQDSTDEYKQIPSWFKDIVLRDEVVFNLSQMDNQGYDKKAQMRLLQKKKQSKEDLLRIKAKLYSSIPKVMQPTNLLTRNTPMRAQLPWNFGKVVS